MIRLIVSDIDGTLIPYGKKGLPDRLFPLVRRLRERGILFGPASGRQFHSLHTLFAPVADEMCFLCENGSVLFGPGSEETAEVLAKSVVPHERAMALSHDILDRADSDVMMSGQNTVYLCRCGQAFVDRMRNHTGNNVSVVDAPEDVPEDIIKISAYCVDGPADAIEALGPRWGGEFTMSEAGPQWLDFTLANKGTGIEGLCRALDIPLADTAAFGDNWNDLSMLKKVGVPILMDTAPEELRRRFPHQCADVCDELERILAQL